MPKLLLTRRGDVGQTLVGFFAFFLIALIVGGFIIFSSVAAVTKQAVGTVAAPRERASVEGLLLPFSVQGKIYPVFDALLLSQTPLGKEVLPEMKHFFQDDSLLRFPQNESCLLALFNTLPTTTFNARSSLQPGDLYWRFREGTFVSLSVLALADDPARFFTEGRLARIHFRLAADSPLISTSLPAGENDLFFYYGVCPGEEHA